MDGYVATGRITQARPRLVGSAARWANVIHTHMELEPHAPTAAEPAPRPLDERLLERWAQARDEWAQATFFLFDPNSWR